MMIVSSFALVFLCTLTKLTSAQYDGAVHSRGEIFRSPPVPPPQSRPITSRVNAEDPSRQYPQQQPQNYQQTSSFAYTQNSYQQPQLRPPQNTYYQQQQQQVRPVQSRPQQYPNRAPTARPVQPLDTRYSNDEPTGDSHEVLTTRRTPTKPKQTTDLPRPSTFDIRFDNYTSRKIVWDGELSKTAEEFSLTLFALLESIYQSENIMISPFSIHSLLTLIAEGAGGNTYAELDRTLGLKSKERARDFHQYITTALKQSSSDVSIQQFSAMVGDENRPIGRDYEDTVEKVFDVEYIPVNFRNVEKTLRDVNQEISQKTNGQIREALTRDEIYKAQLILLSGIHFQGSWKSVFNASQTKRAPFFDHKNERQLGNVKMMFQRGNFAYTAIQDIGAYILELPYGANKKSNNRNNANSDPSASEPFEDRVTMIVVLPKKGQELFTTIDNVNKYGMERLYKELKKVKEEYEDDEVEVYLPRFETTTALNLVEALQNMEIKDLFDQSVADLNKINTNYFVSSILHKTKIRVDEKGTEASAITTSIFQNKATPPVFTANRPFIYFIVDKAARLVLFAGAYKTPQEF